MLYPGGEAEGTVTLFYWGALVEKLNKNKSLNHCLSKTLGNAKFTLGALRKFKLALLDTSPQLQEET